MSLCLSGSLVLRHLRGDRNDSRRPLMDHEAVSPTSYVLKYYFVNDDRTVERNILRFGTLDNLARFLICIQPLCDPARPFTIFRRPGAVKMCRGDLKVCKDWIASQNPNLLSEIYADPTVQKRLLISHLSVNSVLNFQMSSDRNSR